MSFDLVVLSSVVISSCMPGEPNTSSTAMQSMSCCLQTFLPLLLLDVLCLSVAAREVVTPATRALITAAATPAATAIAISWTARLLLLRR
jgi:hypothetical protein